MRSFNRKIAVVVDGFSTGKHIAPALKNRGYDCVHILSEPNHPKRQQIQEHDYAETIVFNSMDEILYKLKVRHVLFCVPGDESGVILSDQINHALNLKTSNGIKYTFAKRNKYLMNEVAKKAGLSVVRHFKSSNLKNLIKWIKKIETWPIVLKPVDSASGDNVYICQTFEEVTKKFYNILSHRNKFGIQNKEVLAEEFNRGTEFLISTVSCDGEHHIVEIWKMNKLTNTIIHDTCEFIDRTNSTLFSIIEQYCCKLLLAFGIRFGACTIELKYLENQPVLIEIGARLTGDAELALTYDVLGYNQLSLMLDAFLNPEVFHRITSIPSASTTIHTLALLLISSVQGKITQELAIVPYLISSAALYSYHLPAIGDEIKITTNITTCPGIIYLRHCDKKMLEQSCAEIRDLEGKGLYSEAIATVGFTSESEVKQEDLLQDSHLLDQSRTLRQRRFAPMQLFSDSPNTGVTSPSPSDNMEKHPRKNPCPSCTIL